MTSDGGDFRRSAEHILCYQLARTDIENGSKQNDANHDERDDDSNEQFAELRLSDKRFAKLLSKTSDYASLENSPDIYADNHPRKCMRSRLTIRDTTFASY